MAAIKKLPVITAFFRKYGFLILCILLLLGNFLITGLGHQHSTDDSGQYIGIGRNLAQSNFFSQDGTAPTNCREPFYPFFNSLVFRIFGTNSLQAIKWVQFLLFIIILFELYFLKEKIFKKYLYLMLFISVFPLFSFYLGEILTEALFIFLIFQAYVFLRFSLRKPDLLLNYCLAAIFIGLAALTKSSFILFPIFICIYLGYYLKYKKYPLKKISLIILTFLLVFLATTTPWMVRNKIKLNNFSITFGRPQLHLYARTVQARLPFDKQINYLLIYQNPFLSHSYRHNHFLVKTYDNSHITTFDKTNPYNAQAQKISSGAEKLHFFERIHPHIFGYITWGFIEIVKLLTPDIFTSKNISFLQLGIYTIVYFLIYIGCILSWIAFFKKNILKKNTLLAYDFLLINTFTIYIAIIAFFFSAVPRFNTPFLIFWFMSACYFLDFRDVPTKKGVKK